MAGTIILGFIIVIDRTAREQQVASARLQSIARDQVRVPVVFTLVLGGATAPFLGTPAPLHRCLWRGPGARRMFPCGIVRDGGARAAIDRGVD